MKAFDLVVEHLPCGRAFSLRAEDMAMDLVVPLTCSSSAFPAISLRFIFFS